MRAHYCIVVSMPDEHGADAVVEVIGPYGSKEEAERELERVPDELASDLTFEVKGMADLEDFVEYLRHASSWCGG